MFPDGSTQQYAVNIIAENLYSQVDEDGYRYQLLDSIIDHKTDRKAIKYKDGWFTSKNGRKTRHTTTKEWHFLVQCRDGTESWVALKELKESNPVEVADYAEMANIIHEPALAWWAPHTTLKKCDRIISAVNARLKKKTHKYGVLTPQTVKEAYALDKENNNTAWRDGIILEMKNNRVAFDIKQENEEVPPGYKYLECYMIFDVKMDLTTRKARYVANGAKTPNLIASTYEGVVS